MKMKSINYKIRQMPYLFSRLTHGNIRTNFFSGNDSIGVTKIHSICYKDEINKIK